MPSDGMSNYLTDRGGGFSTSLLEKGDRTGWYYVIKLDAKIARLPQKSH